VRDILSWLRLSSYVGKPRLCRRLSLCYVWRCSIQYKIDSISSFSIENRSLCPLFRPACLQVPLLRLFPCHCRTVSITKILSSMVKSNVLVIRQLFVESSTPPNSSSNTLFATNGRLAFSSLNVDLLTKIGNLTSVRQALNPSQTITSEAHNQRAAP
jgi:hypothetical protein